jgi:hypothetical protein
MTLTEMNKLKRGDTVHTVRRDKSKLVVSTEYIVAIKEAPTTDRSRFVTSISVAAYPNTPVTRCRRIARLPLMSSYHRSPLKAARAYMLHVVEVTEYAIKQLRHTQRELRTARKLCEKIREGGRKNRR